MFKSTARVSILGGRAQRAGPSPAYSNMTAIGPGASRGRRISGHSLSRGPAGGPGPGVCGRGEACPRAGVVPSKEEHGFRSGPKIIALYSAERKCPHPGSRKMSARQSRRGSAVAALPIFANTPNARRRLGDSIISVPPSLGASYTNIGATGSVAGRSTSIQTIPPPIIGIAPPTTPVTGNNLGSCVQVYASALNNTLKFRTLCAGPNVTIQQDVQPPEISSSPPAGGTRPRPPIISTYL